MADFQDDPYGDEQVEAPGPARRRQARLEPHRGGAVLTLGILGLVLCVICGIIAWVMGNTDLAKMRAGQMDRSGEGITNAGRICGMISVILTVVIIVFYIVVLGAVASTA